MTNYRKSMMESLAEVRDLQEDNMDLMKKAVTGSMQTLKMKDGKLKMDKVTASAIMQILDKVNPANQKKMEKMINDGKKSGIIKLSDFAMSKVTGFKREEVELDEGKKERGPRQLIDPDQEVMVVKKNKVVVIDKKDQDKYLKQGWSLAEETELDEKTKWKMGDGRPRGGAYIENERFWDLDRDALLYIMKDADTAMKANPTGRKAGKYADEVNDAHTVLGWRKKNGIKEEVELDEVTRTDPKVYNAWLKKEIKKAEAAGKKELAAVMKTKFAKEGVELDELIKDPKALADLMKKWDKIGLKDPFNLEPKKGTILVANPKTQKVIRVGEKEWSNYEKKGWVQAEEVELDEGTAQVLAHGGRGQFKVVRNKEDVIDVMYKKKVIAMGDYDRGPGIFWMTIEGQKGQMAFDSAQDIADWFGKNPKAAILGLRAQDKLKIGETFKEYWEIGTDEYREYLEKLTPGESLKEKDVDPADVDDDATDDDRAAASKNIIHQLRKSIDQKGKFDVTFGDNKKVKVDAKIAQAVNDKFMAIKKPTDKEKFQSKIANSYKDMLKVLKNDYNHEETILDRIDRKLKERKNG
jgi:hypothetical protein